jgi:thiol-disulfide isomerase/thioredoxin
MQLTARPRARRAAAGALVLAASLALAACDSGAIGQNTPASNGQSFVSGSAGTTVYGASAGPAVPRVSGTTLSGQKLALAQYHGHVVVMNFWGSWCTPCRAEAPVLASLSHHFTGSGVRFLGIDIRDSPTTAQAFLSDFHISYPSLNDPGDVIALDFRSTVPPAGIPTTLVIGRDGRISARIIGEVSYPGLQGLISRAMAQPS